MSTHVTQEARESLVHFRGVMLFVERRPNRIDRVLLPMAERGTAPREGEAGTPFGVHADETVARPHTAGVLVVDEKDDEVCHVQGVRGHVFLNRAPSDTPRCDLVDRRNLVPFKRIVNGGPAVDLRLITPATDADHDARVAATVFLGEGTVGRPSNSDSGLCWVFTEAFNAHGFQRRYLTLRFHWKPATGPIVIRVDKARNPGLPSCFDPGGEVTLKPGWQAYVYDMDDFDPANPTKPKAPNRDRLEDDDVDIPLPEYVVDHDFKWLYQLVRPERGTLKDWLRSGTFRGAPSGDPVELPAPRWEGSLPLAPRAAAMADVPVRILRPNVSTCYFGGWEEP